MLLVARSCIFLRCLPLDFSANLVRSPFRWPPSWLLAPDFHLQYKLLQVRRFEIYTRKTIMAAGLRSLWPSLTRSNFTLCLRRYRTNRSRLKSSEALVYNERKKLFQRRGFWLFFGMGASVLCFTAYYNRLWEAKQRRRLRVSIEGIGRFFR